MINLQRNLPKIVSLLSREGLLHNSTTIQNYPRIQESRKEKKNQ